MPLLEVRLDLQLLEFLQLFDGLLDGERGTDADGENAEDDDEAEGGVDVDAEPLHAEQLFGTDDHLDTDEGEDDTEGLVEQVELVLQRVEHEVQRTQTEDRRRIGCEDDHRISSHSQDGRDGVDCEQHIGELDRHQGDEEHRCDTLPVGILREQLVAVQ